MHTRKYYINAHQEILYKCAPGKQHTRLLKGLDCLQALHRTLALTSEGASYFPTTQYRQDKKGAHDYCLGNL